MSSVYDVFISEENFTSRNAHYINRPTTCADCRDVCLFPVFCFSISLCSHARVSKVSDRLFTFLFCRSSRKQTLITLYKFYNRPIFVLSPFISLLSDLNIFA